MNTKFKARVMEQEEIELSQWKDQFKKGILELCALALLTEKPHYGYQIYKYMGENLGIRIDIAASYPVLKRMLHAHYIKEVQSPPGTQELKRRRYYAITEQGKQRLAVIKGAYFNMNEGISKLLNTKIMTKRRS
ncbi:MAG: PadR family transcriptional regulator [Leptospiraceae bacterium]|nr:PadR family transcriptional regulator [Leptospiraceae bacterium]MCP5493178.1 PadR family transcriptional regulator [Leptospiraceae bacterium]